MDTPSLHWTDLRAPHDDRWLGLELTVGKRPAPSWRVEFASPYFLRLSCEGAPLLWARIEAWRQGFWWLSAPEAAEALEPLRSSEVDALTEPPGSEGWYAAWARHFARALATSPRSPLHEGRWQLLRGFPPDEGPSSLPDPQVSWWAVVRSLGWYTRQPLAGFVHWGGGYTNLLLGLKAPAELSDSRLKVWRKRARDGTLPPVLALFITSLDCYVVLDGHHRWRAAIEEARPVPLLTLWPSRTRRYPPQERSRDVVERLYLQQDGGRPGDRPIGVERLNALAIEAWREQTDKAPLTRAWPLPGRFPRWDSEVRARLDALGSALPPGFREDLLRGRRPGWPE